MAQQGRTFNHDGSRIHPIDNTLFGHGRFHLSASDLPNTLESLERLSSTSAFTQRRADGLWRERESFGTAGTFQAVPKRGGN